MTGHSTEALKDMLWAKAEPFLFITKEAFLGNLDGWEIKAVDHGGELIAILVTNGAEMHFQGTGRPIPRKIVFGVLQKIIDQHGYALTKTPKDQIRQHRFNTLIGWKAVGEDTYDIHYRIDALRGATQEGSGSCLS